MSAVRSRSVGPFPAGHTHTISPLSMAGSRVGLWWTRSR
jgi:hypothetical protein